MPFYEYICYKCGEAKNLIRPIDDRNKKVSCEKCNGSMERQLATPSFKFIGPGFYSTDYKQNKDAVKELKKMKKQRENRRIDEK
jgi:putative FmdB family regulatory protein